jgi:hypothetical protein
MTDDLNPQAKEMADESMVRHLAAQAEAIWPQENKLFARYQLPDEAEILDAWLRHRGDLAAPRRDVSTRTHSGNRHY